MTLECNVASVTKKLGPKDKFEVSSDTAIADVRVTIYGMNIEIDHSALIQVYDGEFGVTGRKKGTVREVAPVLHEPSEVDGHRRKFPNCMR
jgi:hypothetical protein